MTPEPTPAPSWAALREQLGDLYADICWLAKPESPITREQVERLEMLLREARKREEGC